MDQAKNVIAILMKHLFWVVCGIVVIIAFLTWYMASSSLQAEEATNRKKIEDAKKKIEGVRTKGVTTTMGPKHPNDTTFEETNKITEQVKVDVYNVWKTQNEKQLDILVWPSDLSERFRKSVDSLRPIEIIEFNPTATPPTPLDQEINIDFRETYRDFIKGHIPSLAGRVRAKWHIKSAAGVRGGGDDGLGGAFGGGGDPADGGDGGGDLAGDGGDGGDGADSESEYLVDWAQGDQARLLQRLSVFSGRDNVPTTLQMLYVQEDLWIYSSLLDIIDRTNGPVVRRDRAKIKRIDHLLIGADVRGPIGQVQRIQGAEGGNAPGQDVGNQAGAAEGNPAAGGDGGKGAVGDPADGRYVDKDFQPLTASALRSAYQSTNPNDAYLAVAKRMPVRIGLLMDQRDITQLLLECGNSPLPIEVRQVRINRHRAQGGQRGLGGGLDGGAGAAVGKNPFEQPVEIYGIIYMYNKPNDEKLKVENAAGAAENPDAAPADGADQVNNAAAPAGENS